MILLTSGNQARPRPRLARHAVLGLSLCAATVFAAVVTRDAPASNSRGAKARPLPAEYLSSPAPGTTIDTTSNFKYASQTVTVFNSGVEAISCGGDHSCAILSPGLVKCWGHNYYGGVGDGSAAERVTPAVTRGLWTDATAIASGGFHSCAILSDRNAYCWGFNSGGQLGDGTTADRLTAVKVSHLHPGVKSLAAGGYHTCAILTSGEARCWGLNNAGQVGDGSTAGRALPVGVYLMVSGVKKMVAGAYHSCGLMNSGEVWCWGAGSFSQIGNGKTRDSHFPEKVIGISTAVDISSDSGMHTCALLESAMVKCWGWNAFGQLGDGSTADRKIPVEVRGLAGVVTQVSAGGYHTCALLETGAVNCWGRNTYGQLGDGSYLDQLLPALALNIAGAKAISAGGMATLTDTDENCALLSDFALRCWGDSYPLMAEKK